MTVKFQYVPGSPEPVSGESLIRPTEKAFNELDGNDNNNGPANTSGGAFATIQGAVNHIASNYNLQNFDATVRIATGT